MSQSTVTLNDILHAQRQIGPHIRPLPLRHSPSLSERAGADVWLKLENLQPTGSFKIRGALHKIGKLSAAQKARGLVTASAGNHGLGIAYAAGVWGGVTPHIFVPASAPQAKISKLRRYPVQVQQAGRDYDAAHAAAAAFAERHGALEVSAYNDADVIAGQGTMALEILQERPDTDAILVPVGGGGMIAGIAVASAALAPDCAVIGVQPKASPAALLSLRDGVAHDPYAHEPTIADGLAGGFGPLPFTLIRERVRQILLAEEKELRQAVLSLLAAEQLVVEPSGAIAIVPLLRREPALAGKRVVCVLSGGNVDLSLLREILLAEEMPV